MQKVIDIVIYNEYCTRRFAETVGYHLSIARRPFPSGAFYIACRLAPGQRPPPAENKEARVKKVIEALISKSSAVVIPPADMRHSVQLLLNKLRQSNRLFGLEIPSQEETEQRWLTMAPGEGLSFIQRPNVWFTDRTILFVGGQDQRAALELGSEEVMIVTQEDIKSVTKIDLPSELQVNRLVSREPTLAEGLDLDQLAEEYERSRTLLRDCEEERWNVALWEFARWHALYNTRFLGRAYSDVIGSVRALTREFVEAQKWLPENARLRYPTPAA
jgi:hypothetical protein